MNLPLLSMLVFLAIAMFPALQLVMRSINQPEDSQVIKRTGKIRVAVIAIAMVGAHLAMGYWAIDTLGTAAAYTEAVEWVIPTIVTISLLLVTGLSLLVLATSTHVNQLLRQSNTELESKIRARTEDLQQSRDRALNSEKLLQDIMDSVNAVILVKDLHGSHLLVNTAYERATGLTKAGVLGNKDIDLFPRQIAERFMADDKEVLSSKQIRSTEEKVPHQDGSEHYFWTHKVPLRDSKDRVIGVVGVATDITELKQKERELLEAKKQTEQAMNAKSMFLANMSHEIRTPLNGIMGLANLFYRTSLTRQQKDYLRNILFSAESLMVIINDILDFSKIEAGRMEIRTTPFKLDEIFDNLRAMLSGTASEKGLELLFHCSPDLLQTYVGDPIRIGQIILHLCGNAIKFTEKGHVILSVKQVGRRGEIADLIFEVEDTGIGMPKERQEVLFEPFKQADSTSSRRYGGAGLGLAICKKLALLMGGDIQVVSQPAKGSTFQFQVSLPVKSPSEVNRLNGLSVLIVEDNPASLQTLATSMRDLGAQIRLAGDGRQALEVLQTGHDFQVLMTDWQMPELDGRQLLRKLQSAPQLKPSKVLVLTAYGEEIDSAEMHELGINKVLSKPIMPDQLVNALAAEDISDTNIRGISNGLDTDLTGIRIILAEDNEVNQEISVEMLKDVGAEVLVANNGAEALNLATHEDWDIILMDIQMPIMDGCDATRHIRANSNIPKRPIIALTANVLEADIERYLRLGMSAHIAKPINFEQLFTVILEQLEAYGLHREKRQGYAGQTTSEPAQDESAISAIKLPDKLFTIDRTRGLPNAASKPASYIKALKIYQKTEKDFAAELDTILAKNNLSQARELVHSLKGASGNLGMTVVFKLAAKIEGYLLKNTAVSDADFLELKKLTEASVTDARAIIALNQNVTISVKNKDYLDAKRELLSCLQQSAFISEELIESYRLSARTRIPDKDLDEIVSALEVFDYDEAQKLLDQTG